MTWYRRLLARLKIGTLHASGTMAFPAPEGQHEELTADAKWKREHGFSAATAPDEWTEDIARHNKAVNVAYRASVAHMQQDYVSGLYRPRFLLGEEQESGDGGIPPARYAELLAGAAPRVDEINWDLEMTLQAGARVDVTKSTGVPVLPMPTAEDLAVAESSRRLMTEVQRMEAGDGPRGGSVRSLIGTRKEILAFCGGDEAQADAVEEHARKLFDVADLNDPIPSRV